MAKLLYIEASPRKERSKSIKVASALLEAYQANNPDDEIETLDLWNKELPEFDGYTIDAKYQVMHGAGFDANQEAAWNRIVELCDEFKAADKYVFSVPMWNFSLPYKLKHYFDVIAQPGQTFSFSPDTGYSGLVTGKPAANVLARGGAYGNDDPNGLDFQRGYLKLLQGFIGFETIHEIVIEPTAAAPEDVAKAEAVALEQAKEIGAKL